jgi:hypothetical protein
MSMIVVTMVISKSDYYNFGLRRFLSPLLVTISLFLDIVIEFYGVILILENILLNDFSLLLKRIELDTMDEHFSEEDLSSDS